jgi:hypothetical protein
MAGRKIDLLVLESLWENKLDSKTSVKPFFDGLCKLYDINYAYHKFYRYDDIAYFIKKSKGLCSNYYIAAHGSRGYLHSIDNIKIDLKSLKDIFKNSRSKNRGIYFGSCNFINEENAEEFLNYTNADWVAGYNHVVDWFDSMVIDLAFWSYYLKGNRKFKETQWEIAPEIYKTYPLSIKLGFSVFDKVQSERNVQNSLKKFKEDNPDFMKFLKDIYQK